MRACVLPWARRWVGLLIVVGASTPLSIHAQTGIVVDELLTELQQTLIAIDEAVDDEGLPDLSRVTIRVKSVLTQQTGGSASLMVIHLGANIEHAQVLEMTLELGPPKASDQSLVSASADLLTGAIIESLIAVRKAERGTPPLHLRKLTATTAFVVKVEAGGGAKFRIIPFGLELGASVGSEYVHEIALEFEKQT